MSDDNILKVNQDTKKFVCPDCQNEVTADQNYEIGDIIECPFCGTEFEVTKVDDSGMALEVMPIEEEK